MSIKILLLIVCDKGIYAIIEVAAQNIAHFLKGPFIPECYSGPEIEGF